MNASGCGALRQFGIGRNQEEESPRFGNLRQSARNPRPLRRAKVAIDDRRASRQPARDRLRLRGPLGVGKEKQRRDGRGAGFLVEASRLRR